MVDDEPFNLEVVESFLIDEGYQLFLTENSEEALAELEINACAYRAILLDRMMPDIDG